MPKYIVNLLVFVAILVVLNFLFSQFEYGIHISIVGSIVLTLVVSVVMNMIFAGRR